MAALLLKLYGKSTTKCLVHLTKIASGKANLHITAKNFRVKCDDRPVFTTRLALPPDYENVVDFMCESYYKHEPIIVNIGLEGTEAPPVWRFMLHHGVKAGYSIIAESRDNCIVGVALNYAIYIGEEKNLQALAKCCDKGQTRDIIEFFDFVMQAPKLWERYCVTTIFEQSCLAVNEDFQGLGIAKTLIEESWILARDCGFRLFRLDCNNVYCARIAQRFGWSLVFDIPFRQYVKNGEVIFKHVKEPHDMCRVFVDDLRYCKTYRLPYKKSTPKAPPSF